MRLYILSFAHPENGNQAYRIVTAENIPQAIDAVWKDTEEGHWLVDSGMVGLADMMIQSFDLPYSGQDFVKTIMDYWGNETEELKILRGYPKQLSEDEITVCFKEEYAKAQDDTHDIEYATNLVMDHYTEKYSYINFHEMVEDIKPQEDFNETIKCRFRAIQKWLGDDVRWVDILKIWGVLSAMGITDEQLLVGPSRNPVEEMHKINNMTEGIIGENWDLIYELVNLPIDSTREILWGIIKERNQ